MFKVILHYWALDGDLKAYVDTSNMYLIHGKTNRQCDFILPLSNM
jgi:hypothetical protein